MRTFRPRPPAPALAISMVALAAALGGTSYAAFNLGKNAVGTKQLKNNAVTTKKIKNGAVTASKLNTKGLTVPNATNATNATNANHANNADTATNATTATTARAASSPATLGNGQTETGVWALADTSAAAGNRAAAEISFAHPLASPPTPHVIPVGGPAPAGCSGTAAAPAASPGNLCIFESFLNNATLGFEFDPVTASTSTTSTLGAAVLYNALGSGNFLASGTWAVTG